MLTWVAVLAAVGALALALRWALRRTDGLGRPIAFPRYAVAGLALLSVVAAVPVIRHSRLETRLSQVASRLVGHDVRVHCQTAGEEFVDAGAELGYVRFDAGGRPEPRTVIKHAQCGLLRNYIGRHGRSPDRDEIIAVHVLTHEAMHMRGLTNEAEAECAAMQRDASTAALLGASAGDASALARRYFAVYYADVPDDYRSGACTAGGQLDEKLANPPW
ncbi:MAG: hypothetical protein QOK42_1677 [Frankiaceae bacterium]|nr:hypothetical protein [Frankiaceae bacterium]